MPGEKYRDASTKRSRYATLKGALWTERSSFDSHWKEIADWMLPRRVRFQPSDRNRGDKRNQNIIDSTARFAARTLQSGLHAGLTSPARPWMRLTTPDPDLAKYQPVKVWLHEVTQRMLTVFQQTNLYNVLPIVYGDMGVFGTAAMSVVEDERDLFRCYPYPIGSYALGLNKRNLAATFVREYELSVRQVVEEFGVIRGTREIDWSNISQTVKSQWDSSNYEAPVEICWVVCPNEYPRQDRLEAKYLPWTSCHFENASSQNVFLRESGFMSFPILAPRWDITGEDTYGTDCPGMTALGDVKQLQTMQKDKARAIKKMIDPPLTGPTALKTQKTSLIPGDITYLDTREGMAGLRSIHETRLDIDHLRQDIGETQYRIQRAFYEDLFLMLATADQRMGADRPTAREVAERHEEKLLALGPVLERTNDELLEPMVDRIFLLMEMAGLIPEPPSQLDNVKLKVEYTSVMAEAQKLIGVIAQDRFVQTTASLVEFFPETRYKLDAMQVVDNYRDLLGVDPRMVRPTEEARAMMAQDQKQAAAAQQAENMQKVAGAVKDAGTTEMGGDTALTRLLTAAGAPVQ